jgi:hypothetical protein
MAVRTRYGRLLLALIAVGALPACSPIGSPVCLGYCGGDGVQPVADGKIELEPRNVELRVGETRTVMATLSGPIAYFVRYDWRFDSAFLRVTPLACSTVADEQRYCLAEVTGHRVGSTALYFAAGLDPMRFDDIYGRASVSIGP